MNRDAFEKLVRELDHLLHDRPAMGTLSMKVRRTPHMLVATQQDGVIRLSYAHTGWLDVLGVYRFKSFCRARGFSLRTELWWKSRVTSAAIGFVATNAAQPIDASSARLLFTVCLCTRRAAPIEQEIQRARVGGEIAPEHGAVRGRCAICARLRGGVDQALPRVVGAGRPRTWQAAGARALTC